MYKLNIVLLYNILERNWHIVLSNFQFSIPFNSVNPGPCWSGVEYTHSDRSKTSRATFTHLFRILSHMAPCELVDIDYLSSRRLSFESRHEFFRQLKEDLSLSGLVKNTTQLLSSSTRVRARAYACVRACECDNILFFIITLKYCFIA